MKESIIKVFDHLYTHPKKYLFVILGLLLIFGLWPFNFAIENRAIIRAEDGLMLARPGTAYKTEYAEKLHGLTQFSIHLDLATSSVGLSAFEKIFSYAHSEKDMNFIVGQWKNGVILHIRANARQKEIHFGELGVLNIGDRTALTITYDGMNLLLYQDGRRIKARKTGPLSLDHWSRDYPLVIGTDGHGKSQWTGTIYEIAMWDRPIAPGEVQGLRANEQTAYRRQQAGGSGTGGGTSLQVEGDSREQIADRRALIHYVFRSEFTYETEYSGKKALGVRDLGKGPSADMIIPEQFMPARRAILAWESDWTDKATNWQDAAVNIIGFIPFGVLLFVQVVKRKFGVGTFGKEQTANSQQPTVNGKKYLGAKVLECGSKRNWADPKIMSKTRLAYAVLLTVAAGFAVSLTIEWLQAYLPSRDSSIRDLIMNTMGMLIGTLVAAWQWQN